MLGIDKIYCADCLTLMKDIEDNSIDLTVTSPPYDNLRTYKGYTFDFEGIAKELYRITKQGGVVVWVVGDQTVNGSETGTSFRQALYFKEIGFNLHDTMIYQKKGTGACGSNLAYWQSFEFMFVLSKGVLVTVNRIKDKINISYDECKDSIIVSGRRKRDGNSKTTHRGKVRQEIGYRENIWSYLVGCFGDGKSEHPAVFPEALARDHIISWSNEGDLVLDPMCGSGTTCKMAYELNRHYIGIDISEAYCEIARERLMDAQAQLRLF